MNMRISSAALALAAAAALTAGTVAPAAAASDPARPAAQTKSEPAATPTAKEDKRRYCVEETIVGSRIPKRACRTRSAWIALTGVDPAEAR